MNAVQQAYSDFLVSKPWDYFATITFRQPRRNVIRTQALVSRVMLQVGVSRAFLAVEPHRSGDLHVHALMSSPFALPWRLQEHFEQRFGYSRVGAVESMGGAAAYCAKYVLKDTAVADHYSFVGQPYNWDRMWDGEKWKTR